MNHDRDRCLRQGIAYLRTRQLPSGEFRTIIARDSSLSVEARHDPSPFATAHIVSSLAACHLDECGPLIHRAAEFLIRQRLPGGVWKFWAQGHPGFGSTPSDMDDTSVVCLALRDAAVRVRQNAGLLLGNRGADGRFYTWIQPRARHAFFPGCWPYLVPGLKSYLGQKRFFALGEADRLDVDAVVNANAACWLATRPSETATAVEWLVRVVERGEEVATDRYYQSKYALYYAIARGMRHGVAGFFRAATPMRNSILEEIAPDGSIGQGVQDTALAAVALAAVDGPQPVIDRALSLVLSRQDSDGSWPAEAYFYGGWSRDLCWGAAELTTAFCLEAVALAGQRSPR